MKNIKRNVIIIGMLVLLFMIILTLVIENQTANFDKVVSNIIVNNISASFANAFEFLTVTGGPRILPIIVITTIIIFAIKKEKYYSLCIALTMILSSGSYIILKNIIQRARPEDVRFITETGFSFPSGHSANNMAFCGILIYFVYHNIKNKYIRAIAIAFLGAWILITGMIRIYFGVHYASDVMAGFTLGLICIFIGITAFSKKLKFTD